MRYRAPYQGKVFSHSSQTVAHDVHPNGKKIPEQMCDASRTAESTATFIREALKAYNIDL